MKRYEGPFSIIKRVGKVAYKLQLPPTIKAHPVFHVSQLKPYAGDAEDPSREEITRPTTSVRETHEIEAEAILSDRVVRKGSQTPVRELLVKWKGRPDSEASWEPLEDLWRFQEVIEAYEELKETRASPG